METYWQHGDVLVKAIDELPAGLVEAKTNVLQEGEATGHAHRLYGDGFTVFEEPKTKEKYLRLVQPAALRHEEHKQIDLPPGNYRIGIVREYDHFSEEARRVAD